jgi:hypothetical protein
MLEYNREEPLAPAFKQTEELIMHLSAQATRG